MISPRKARGSAGRSRAFRPGASPFCSPVCRRIGGRSSRSRHRPTEKRRPNLRRVRTEFTATLGLDSRFRRLTACLAAGKPTVLQPPVSSNGHGKQEGGEAIAVPAEANSARSVQCPAGYKECLASARLRRKGHGELKPRMAADDVTSHFNRRRKASRAT